jgi:hypothetical protein
LTKNRKKLELLAKELMNRETIEGKDLDKFFDDIGLAKPSKKVKGTTIPAPVTPVPEGEPVPQLKKAPAVPKLVPKQTPAPTD